MWGGGASKLTGLNPPQRVFYLNGLSFSFWNVPYTKKKKKKEAKRVVLLRAHAPGFSGSFQSNTTGFFFFLVILFFNLLFRITFLFNFIFLIFKRR